MSDLYQFKVTGLYKDHDGFNITCGDEQSARNIYHGRFPGFLGTILRVERNEIVTAFDWKANPK